MTKYDYKLFTNILNTNNIYDLSKKYEITIKLLLDEFKNLNRRGISLKEANINHELQTKCDG